ncbi:hypothetical protein HDF09_000473 [Edaphobacter lichenicola]|uniref:Uncharacterized protein n=1 Tax=Tunturiibacter empetritectus TaxID=3069691 RepID=A0A7W8MPT6_9BACT|nr:hypothetical protein [Edaphobacter lichenicola]
MSRKRGKRRRTRRSPEAQGNYCETCSKIAWGTRELAEQEVERLKGAPGARRPDLIDSYKCCHGLGWHVGHNYKLRWISLCIGEHK